MQFLWWFGVDHSLIIDTFLKPKLKRYGYLSFLSHPEFPKNGLSLESVGTRSRRLQYWAPGLDSLIQTSAHPLHCPLCISCFYIPRLHPWYLGGGGSGDQQYVTQCQVSLDFFESQRMFMSLSASMSSASPSQSAKSKSLCSTSWSPAPSCSHTSGATSFTTRSSKITRWGDLTLKINDQQLVSGRDQAGRGQERVPYSSAR